MEQVSSSFLQIPGTLFEILLGRSSQTWGSSLHKSISRLWSSLQYQAELGHSLSGTSLAGDNIPGSILSTRQEPVLDGPKVDCGSCLLREDAEMVMGRLGLSCSGGWEGQESLLSTGEISRLFEEKEPSLEEVREAFGVFDVNQDGFIDAEELHRVLRGLGFGEGKEVEDCERMIRAFDENGDGRIDFREFVKMMENCFC
ncbi:probable calcium-binding protein CML45 [Punica granatum]|uniref:Probable calcium-binding protein CML45 n=1 Tax=Punica granatum TaxID=22663 RepID=A0A6P8E777_PUNGR|nr:probable calcium-binding protein CML45 [Punica granatum]